MAASNVVGIHANEAFQLISSSRIRNMTFLKPSTRGIGSLSAKALNLGVETFNLPVTSISDLAKYSSIDSIPLFKFDAEGFEREIMKLLASLSVLPQQIVFKFDIQAPVWKCAEILKFAHSPGNRAKSI